MKKQQLNLQAPWAVSQIKFNELKTLDSDIEFIKEKKILFDYKTIDNTAIIQVVGVLMRYDNFWSWMMGWSTVEEISLQIEKANEDKNIKAILLDINSPGGESDGIPELAETIRANKKPVYSYISNMGASGAYWLAAASQKIIMHRSAFAGSIGVIASYYIDEDEEKSIDIVSGISPEKNPDIKTEEGYTQIQNHVDQLAGIFIKDIADYRGTTVEYVRTNYGKGDIMIGRDSLKNGLVDTLGSFKTALNLTKEKKTEVKMESKTVNKAVTSYVINEKWLIDNHHDIYSNIKQYGIMAERTRIQMIDKLKFDINNKDAVKLVQDAKVSNTTAGQLAIQLNQLESKQVKKIATARKEDSEKLPKVKHTETEKETDELKPEVKSVIEKTVKKLWRAK